jgi:FixJ family two-component response regulator
MGRPGERDQLGSFVDGRKDREIASGTSIQPESLERDRDNIINKWLMQFRRPLNGF